MLKKILEFIAENGGSENEIIVKCDQESARRTRQSKAQRKDPN